MIGKIRSFLFENRTAGQTVAKNTVWLALSHLGGRLIRATVIVYAARVLGAEGWGVLSYALTLAGFFTFVIDPGLNAILVRDASRGVEREQARIFSTILGIKLCFMAAGVLIVLLVGPSFSTLPGARALLPIVAAVLVFDNLREFFSAFARAKEKMEWEAGIFLLTNAAIALSGFAALAVVTTPYSLGWGYAAGTAAGALAGAYVARRRLREVAASFASNLVVPILRSAWPFAVVGALGVLLTNTDILIISWLGTAADVGVYSAAARLIQVLYLVPTIIQFSVMPLFSRLANRDNAKFRTGLEKTLGMVFLVSVPLALGGAVIGTQVMELLFGAQYAVGGLAFKILALTLLVDFPAIVISGAVFAYGHQKSLIISSALAGGANVILDVVLIPPFGIAGSAVATLCALLLSNWYLWRTMKRLNAFAVLPRLRNIIASGVIMAAGTFGLLALGASAALIILVSGALYLAVLSGVFREPLLTEAAALVMSKGTGRPALS